MQYGMIAFVNWMAKSSISCFFVPIPMDFDHTKFNKSARANQDLLLMQSLSVEKWALTEATRGTENAERKALQKPHELGRLRVAAFALQNNFAVYVHEDGVARGWLSRQLHVVIDADESEDSEDAEDHDDPIHPPLGLPVQIIVAWGIGPTLAATLI